MSSHDTSTGGFEQFSNLIICWRCFVLILQIISISVPYSLQWTAWKSKAMLAFYFCLTERSNGSNSAAFFFNMLACFLTRRCLSHPPTWQCKVSPISQHLCLSLYGSLSKAQTLLRTIFSDYPCSPNHGDLLCHHSPQISVPCTPSCSLCQLISGMEQWSCRSVPAENITQHWPEWRQWALKEEWTDAALH